MKAIPFHQSDEMSSYHLHILWASCGGFYEELDGMFRFFIKCHGFKSAMVSILEMSKYDCITKVGCDIFVVLVTRTVTVMLVTSLCW